MGGHRRPHHAELGQEPGGEGGAGLAQQEDGEGQGQERLAMGQAAVVGDLVCRCRRYRAITVITAKVPITRNM